MRKLFFALLFAMTMFVAKSQTKAVYVEAGGPGIASANFDMRFTKSNGGIGGRLGIGGFAINDGAGSRTGLLTVPAEINYLMGRDNKHYFEVGAGASLLKVSSSFNGNSDVFSQSFGHLWFGYRVQPPDGGFLFRAGLCPIFNKYGFIPYYMGVSFGYVFPPAKHRE